jgi:hypothetical protein
MFRKTFCSPTAPLSGEIRTSARWNLKGTHAYSQEVDQRACRQAWQMAGENCE